MAAKWLIGEVARLGLEIVNINDQLADPTTLRLKVKTPSGVITTYAWPGAPEIVRDSVGVFHAYVALTEPGTYAFRFESDGVLMGAGERTLQVQKSLFA